MLETIQLLVNYISFQNLIPYPKNPLSVWLGVPRSQIPTSSAIQWDIKNTSSTAQNKIDDEMNDFFKN